MENQTYSLIKANAQNIQSLTFPVSKPPEEKPETLNASAIYAFPNLSLDDIQVLVNRETDKDLKKKLNKIVYGATALHFSLINPDIKVFEYVLSLYRKLNIDIDKIQHVSEYRKVGASMATVVPTIILPGETLFNIALTLGDKEKIKLLEAEGLAQFTCPKLPVIQKNHGEKIYNLYFLKQQYDSPSSILEYCLHMSRRENKKFQHVEDKIKFYLSFALSYASGPELFQKSSVDKMLPNKQIVGYRHYLLSRLLLVPDMYSVPEFKKVLLPIILSQKAFPTCRRLLNQEVLGPVPAKNIYEIITENFVKSSAGVEDLQALREMFKKLQEMKEASETKNLSEVMKKVDIFLEKKQLEALSPELNKSIAPTRTTFKV